MAFLQQERETTSNAARKSGDFYTRSKVGVSGWKITNRRLRGKGEFWINWPDRLLAEGRPGWTDITRGVGSAERKGFPSGTSDKETPGQCRRHKRRWFNPWVGKIPWRRAWQPTPVFLPGESSWTEEPGRLQFMELQRVEHDWSDSAWSLVREKEICQISRVGHSG